MTTPRNVLSARTMNALLHAVSNDMCDAFAREHQPNSETQAGLERLRTSIKTLTDIDELSIQIERTPGSVKTREAWVKAGF